MFQIRNLEAEEAMDYIKSHDCFVLDVRTPYEFQTGFIPGAVNLPITELHFRYDEIPDDREVVVYCSHGVRSGRAAHFLLSKGYAKVAHISGGLEEMNLE